MVASTRYDRLKDRVDQLEAHLLPPIDPTGAYSAKDLDLVRGFYLLCHAEIEAYLEDYALEIVTRAYSRWLSDKTIVSPIIFHLAYAYRSEKKEPPYAMVVLAFKQLEKSIKKNHGLKEDNLNNFFKPIGFTVDETLKTILNEFGKTRGEIAHTSFHTQQPLDPQTEKNNVRQILLNLEIFDQELSIYESLGELPRTPIITQWKKFSFVERLKILVTGKHTVK